MRCNCLYVISSGLIAEQKLCKRQLSLLALVAHRRVDFEMLGGKIIISQWTEIVKSEMRKRKWEALKAT